VTYDASRGYIAISPDLRQPIVALSLGGLRRKIEAAMLPVRRSAHLKQSRKKKG
jgi:hypothetical protein